MRFFHLIGTAVFILCTGVSIQAQPAPAKDAQSETKGIPPRASAADYQTRAQAGAVTIAAEFTGHALPTAEGPLTTEDYIGVEAALFGPDGAHLTISASDFSLRLNGKKMVPSQPYGVIVSSLRDPEWVPPEAPSKKSKGSIGGGGGGQGESNEPPAPVKIPVPLQRAMAQRVQKASLPEGDRPLPQAGLLFFQHRGKTENLQTVELVYDGPAGKAILRLQP